MPQYPPPACPARDWPDGLVGAVQAWLGLAVSWARQALRSYAARPPRPPVASSLDSDPSFICLDSPRSHTCLSSGCSARELWRPLAWPGHWPDPDEEWRMAAMAAGSRACLSARGPWRGHTLLCFPQPWPWDCAWSLALALMPGVHYPSTHSPRARSCVALGVGYEAPVPEQCWLPLQPGLEGHGHSGRAPRGPGCLPRAIFPVRHTLHSQPVSTPDHVFKVPLSESFTIRVGLSSTAFSKLEGR